MKRKLIDEKGRLFGAVSLIDILAVLIVVVLGFAVYTRFFTKEATAVAAVNDTFEYDLRIENVRMLTIDALREGDRIYDTDNDIYLGTITGIEYEDALVESKLADGTYAYAPAENRYDVTLHITAEGLVSSGRYYASRSFEISANAQVWFHTKYCSTSGFVWEII